MISYNEMGAFPDLDRGRGRSRGRGRTRRLRAKTAEIPQMREQHEAAFGFEKLDAYQRAVEFVATDAGTISEFPSGYSSLSDQLRRAALSVPVNIAEGVGRTSLACNRSRFGAGMHPNSRRVQGVVSRESGQVGDRSFTPAANCADAEQDVPLIVHVHGYVH